MYVAFKCFMLHVFHAVRRVRKRREMGRSEPVAGRYGARRAGASGWGHDGTGVRLRGQSERMGMEAGCADRGGSGVRAGVR